MKLRSRKYSMLNTINPDENRLWRKIESNILTDQAYREENRDSLNKAIENLILIEPKKNLWAELERELTAKAQPGRSINAVQTLLRIAAMILLISSCLYFFLWPHREKLLSEGKAGSDESIDVFLTRICETHPNKCRDVDFIELQGEILKLQEEKSKIENSIFVGSGDEEINKVNEMINDQIGSLKTQINNYVAL